MNLTEEMRRLTEESGANVTHAKTPAEIADDAAFIERCKKRNPFSAECLNLTNQMRLMTLDENLAATLQEQAADNPQLDSLAARVAGIEKSVGNIEKTLKKSEED